MKNTTHTLWWRTKTFKTGLGIFIVIALLVAVLFGDQISNLLDLFGSKAGTPNILTVDDDSAIYPSGHGYLNAPDANLGEGVIYVEPVDSDNGEGYITLQ